MEVITELEKKICDFIEKQYKCKFVGKVRVVKDRDEYSLWLTLDNWMTPILICLQTEDEDEFFEYIKKQLKYRHLVRVGFFKMTQEHGKDRKE